MILLDLINKGKANKKELVIPVISYYNLYKGEER